MALHLQSPHDRYEISIELRKDSVKPALSLAYPTSRYTPPSADTARAAAVVPSPCLAARRGARAAGCKLVGWRLEDVSTARRRRQPAHHLVGTARAARRAPLLPRIRIRGHAWGGTLVEGAAEPRGNLRSGGAARGLPGPCRPRSRCAPAAGRAKTRRQRRGSGPWLDRSRGGRRGTWPRRLRRGRAPRRGGRASWPPSLPWPRGYGRVGA